MAVIPWSLAGIFLLLFLGGAVCSYMLQCSALYVVQDALAFAALAGQTPDLEVYSSEGELVITDLSRAKEAFMQSFRQCLSLDEGFYPDPRSVYFSSEMPFSVEVLDLYNVSYGSVYKTDLLTAEGKLQFLPGNGIAKDRRVSEIGNIKKQLSFGQRVRKKTGRQSGNSIYIQMHNGRKKEICGTSVYARIRFGIKAYGGKTLPVELDILTDVVSSLEE